jgi:hypothetical protein
MDIWIVPRRKSPHQVNAFIFSAHVFNLSSHSGILVFIGCFYSGLRATSMLTLDKVLYNVCMEQTSASY